MRVALAALVLVSVAAGVAGADELRAARARAAQDLRCPERKVKTDLFIDEGIEKIDARGCGRSAEYLNAPEGLVLALLELEPTPAMSVKVARELDCSMGAVSIRRTWEPATRTSELHGWGCGREAEYDVAGDTLTLRKLIVPASAELAKKVADDLGCPVGEVTVKELRTATGAFGASTRGCRDNQPYEYSLSPFERTVQPPSKGMVDVMRRAAADLSCPIEKLSVKWDGKQTKVQDPDRAAFDGCGRSAIYERKAYGYVAVPAAKRETP